jgi:hypothetical protein
LALNEMGSILSSEDDRDAVRALHTEQLEVERARGNTLGVAKAVGHLTVIALADEDWDTAFALATENLERERHIGNHRGVALTLWRLADVHTAWGESALARTLLERGLEIARQIKEGAEAYWPHSTALSLCHRHGNWNWTDVCLEEIAILLVSADPHRAARFLGAAEGVRTRYRTQPVPQWEQRRAPVLAALADRLGAEAYQDAWAAGRSAPVEAVVVEAASTDPGLMDGRSLFPAQ